MRPLASTPLAGGSPRSVESLSHPTRSPSQETRTVLVHTNYNTESVRKDGGFEVTVDAVKKLKLKHKEHIAAYGEGRLTGNHETTDIHTFSWCRQPWSFDPGQPRDVVE